MQYNSVELIGLTQQFDEHAFVPSSRPTPTRPGLTKLTSVLQRCWAVAKLQRDMKKKCFHPYFETHHPPKQSKINNNTDKKKKRTNKNPEHQRPAPTSCASQQALQHHAFCRDTCRGFAHTHISYIPMSYPPRPTPP